MDGLGSGLPAVEEVCDEELVVNLALPALRGRPARLCAIYFRGRLCVSQDQRLEGELRLRALALTNGPPADPSGAAKTGSRSEGDKFVKLQLATQSDGLRATRSIRRLGTQTNAEVPVLHEQQPPTSGLQR